MILKCRAKLSDSCYDGRECVHIYGEDSMEDDGTFDGESVVCDACYIKGGQPAIRFPASRQQVVEHVDRELGFDGPSLLQKAFGGGYSIRGRVP